MEIYSDDIHPFVLISLYCDFKTTKSLICSSNIGVLADEIWILKLVNDYPETKRLDFWNGYMNYKFKMMKSPYILISAGDVMPVIYHDPRNKDEMIDEKEKFDRLNDVKIDLSARYVVIKDSKKRPRQISCDNDIDVIYPKKKSRKCKGYYLIDASKMQLGYMDTFKLEGACHQYINVSIS